MDFHCVKSDDPFGPKLNEFPGFIVEHFYFKFDDPTCVVFLDIVRKKTDTDKQR